MLILLPNGVSRVSPVPLPRNWYVLFLQKSRVRGGVPQSAAMGTPAAGEGQFLFEGWVARGG